MDKLIELSFSETDLLPLQRLLYDFFESNSLYFNRLSDALSSLGLTVGLSYEVELIPFVEKTKQEVINTLKKGLSHAKTK